jgi:hypothetical protein
MSNRTSIAERLRVTAELSRAGLDLVPLNGKHPRDKGWRKKQYTRVEIIGHVTAGGNTGVRLSEKQLVLDVDPRHGGTESLERLSATLGVKLATSPLVRTGGGGLHIYLNKPAEVRVYSKLTDYPGIDIRSSGFQVVAPGSIHPETKRPYELDDPLEEIGAPPPAPMGLLALVERRPPGVRFSEEATLLPSELASVLAGIDARCYGRSDGTGHYDEWINLSMACHAVTDGAAESEWLTWCTSDPDYAGQEDSLSYKWSSFDADRHDGVGVGTLRKHVDVYPEAADKLRAILAAKDFEALSPEEIAACDRDCDGGLVASLVRRINERFCGVLENGRFAILMKDTDSTFEPPRQVWTRMSREDFRHYYEDERMKLPDTSREVSVAEIWLKHPSRLKYSGVVMDPRETTGDDKLNLWRGWAVEPRPGDWSLLRNLIDETLCNGDVASGEYVRRWIAFMLQRPWKSPETAIAFRGHEGTGKGTLGRALMGIAGVHGLTVASSSQFAGRFNAHLRNCVFLFADEALWPGQKDAEGILKQLVTEPIVSYEAKGRDIVTGRNLVHLMLASNEKWIVPAGADARRFAVFDVSDNRRGDREFFGKLHKQLDNGGLAGMVHDLMALDLDGWHPALNVPQTNALADQKQRSLGPIMKWWQETLSRAELPTIEVTTAQWIEEAITLGAVDRNALLDDCDRYLKRNRIFHEKATPSALIEAGRELGLATTRINRGKERAWILPPLAQMRTAFERHVGAQALFD